MRQAPQGKHEEREPSSACTYLLVFAAAAMLGFLSFNFFSIIKVSHVHISIAHAHKTTAFCAFIGCKLGSEDSLGEAPSPLLPRPVAPPRAADSCCCPPLVRADINRRSRPGKRRAAAR